MDAGQVVVNAYILYAFLGVIILLLIALLGAVFRMLYVVGGLKADVAALWRAIDDMKQEIASVRQEIASVRQEIASVRQEIADLREQVARLRERVAENRGLLLELHRRIDLLMRHRHDEDTGNVVLTPAAPEPEHVAD